MHDRSTARSEQISVLKRTLHGLCRFAPINGRRRCCASTRAVRSSPVSDSLSIIVPVHNAEAALNDEVQHLLEVLPELTGRFEILVVDDGSTDNTVEQARELTCAYPQVRLIRHVQPRGLEAAVKTGIQWAQGQTVFVQECPAAVSPTDLRRLWSLRYDREHLPLRRSSGAGLFDSGLVDRLTTWGQALRNLARGLSVGTVHMVRRQAAITVPADGIDAGEVHSAADRSRTDEPHALPAPARRAAILLKHLRDLVTGE